MRAGELRNQIVLQHRVETPDGQGGATVTWTEIATVYGHVKDSDGREQLLREGVITSQGSTEVIVRYRDDLSVKDRVVFGDRTLNIGSIADVDGKRRALRLACMEEGL